MTGTGEIRTVNKERDPRLWRAVACSLGLCGIFTKITLNLTPLFHVRVVNRSISMQTALAEVAATFARHDYAQYFWFPFNSTVTLQTADVTAAPLTWTRANQLRKEVNGWLETLATHLVHPLLVRAPWITPLFDRFAARSIGNNEKALAISNRKAGRSLSTMARAVSQSPRVSVSSPEREYI
ncbi:MAG TPA: D-arabinono-1,4-lactone oxidase [Chloroflexota bacterium]|nr:D-arabinono-1,4-lactone oxidase [Chloroflexota bacterium]